MYYCFSQYFFPLKPVAEETPELHSVELSFPFFSILDSSDHQSMFDEVI